MNSCVREAQQVARLATCCLDAGKRIDETNGIRYCLGLSDNPCGIGKTQ